MAGWTAATALSAAGAAAGVPAGTGPAGTGPGLASPAAAPLTVAETDAVFEAVGEVGGAGAQAERKRLLAAMFERATLAERQFLIRLLAGELHQGALEGVMIEAVARAAEVPAEEVRRACLLAGSLPEVAQAALGAAAAHAPAAAGAGPGH